METNPTPIIVTKLYPPVTLGATVSRQRLLKQLGQQSLRKLTLVQSPAGFGKSTLLAQWREVLPFASAWLSLDRDDAEPARFLKYLIAALQTTQQITCEEARRCLEGSGRLAAHDVIGCLINEIVELQQPLALFLDDYHLVDRPEISAILQDLINFSPSNFYLVVASRTVPSFPVASLRAQGRVTEIGEADMRFDREEASGFFVELRGLDLSPQEVDALTGKTEGWIAGLQLATLSLQDPEHRQNFIEDFSGNIRDVADYLATEVLGQQDQDTQLFLLKTSLLERINAELAHALTGRSDSQAVLEALEAKNLFLVPLDNVRKWYRYHHLFREFLYARLRRELGQELKQLASAASHWFLQAGFTEEAINYALETGDGQYAADLLEQHALSLIYDGRLPQVERWIRKVPKQIYSSSFRLRTYHCWALMHMGFWQQTEAVLDQTEGDLRRLQGSSEALPEPQAQLIQAEINVLRLANAVISDNIERAATLGAQPLPDDQEFSYFAGTQANAMGFLCLARSELAEALAWGQKALVRHRQSGSVYGQVYAHCVMGLSLIAKGALNAALEQMDNAERLVVGELGNHAFSAAMVNVIKGAILYEWNQLSRARELLVDSLPLVEECASLEIRNLAFICLSRIDQAQGNFNSAQEFQDRALRSYRESVIDRTRVRLSYERIRLILARCNNQQQASEQALTEASRIGVDIALPLPSLERWEPVAFFRALIYSRLALVEGKPESVLMALPGIQALTRKAGREMMALEVGLILAQAHYQAGDTQRAYACALEVLEASQREGYLRLFLDEGLNALPLWRSLLGHLDAESRGGTLLVKDCLRKILLTVDGAGQAESEPQLETPNSGADADQLVEALSTRELAVLSLMSKGLSNKQIAEQLSVSVNTVRWHVSNILGKLDAQNRTEAVAKAKELALIL